MGILQQNPLKVFQLYDRLSYLEVTFENVIGIFKSLSQKPLRYFWLRVHPLINKSVSKSDLEDLDTYFTAFLNNSRLYHLRLLLETKNENRADFLKSFNYLKDFILKKKVLVGKMEKF